MKSATPHHPHIVPASSRFAAPFRKPLRWKFEIRNLHDTNAIACRKSRFGLWVTVAVLVLTGASSADVATFEDLALAPQSYWNGDDGSGGFLSGGASFANSYDVDWEFWYGFAYSNRTDANSTGLPAQYNAIAGSGQGGSANYAVAFVGWGAPPTVTFADPQQFSGLYVTNNCYAYYDMRDGGPFSKKFGGQTGDDEDWFKLTITGIDPNEQTTGVVEFYLADFRFVDNARDYILDSWAFVDLASLGEVQTLQFTLSSSDTGDFGMNTPGYFCLDTIVSGIHADPETTDAQTDSTETLPGDELWQDK